MDLFETIPDDCLIQIVKYVFEKKYLFDINHIALINKRFWHAVTSIYNFDIINRIESTIRIGNYMNGAWLDNLCFMINGLCYNKRNFKLYDKYGKSIPGITNNKNGVISHKYDNIAFKLESRSDTMSFFLGDMTYCSVYRDYITLYNGKITGKKNVIKSHAITKENIITNYDLNHCEFVCFRRKTNFIMTNKFNLFCNTGENMSVIQSHDNHIEYIEYLKSKRLPIDFLNFDTIIGLLELRDSIVEHHTTHIIIRAAYNAYPAIINETASSIAFISKYEFAYLNAQTGYLTMYDTITSTTRGLCNDYLKQDGLKIYNIRNNLVIKNGTDGADSRAIMVPLANLNLK